MTNHFWSGFTGIFSTILALIGIAILQGCGSPQEAVTESTNATQTAPAEQQNEADTVDERPNFLVIMADDMALTDLGSFGGEIDTPNLDTLAMRGIRLANFHASPLCAPTRAMFLSGTDNHLTGIGAMRDVAFGALGREGGIAISQNKGYEGHLHPDIATLPEVLRDAGYHTYMTGKWHLGYDDDQSPVHRGFERSFALLESGAGHLSELAVRRGAGPTYREDGEVVPFPENFYSTHHYTEKMIDFIESHRDDGQPFFAWLAYTAPHWPLQAPRESIEKYQDRYDEGFDVLFEQRLQGIQEQGILNVEGELNTFPRVEGNPAWDEMTDEEKAYSSRLMAIHAAMVDDLDVYVGVVINYLERIGELDNTYIIFMSDNGVDGNNIGAWGGMRGWPDECCINDLENLGNADSYTWLGENWGRALAVPHRMYKTYTSEGGTHTVAFITPPNQNLQGRVERRYVSIMDIMPTLLDVAGLETPAETYNGRPIRKILGHSILDLIEGQDDFNGWEETGIGVEIHGQMSYLKGEYKILKQKDQLAQGDWQLYHLPTDPAEVNDLSETMPELREQLINDYLVYEERVGVVSWEKYRSASKR